MDAEQIRKYCLSMPLATEKVQWGNDLVFKIGEKMFAVIGLEPKRTQRIAENRLSTGSRQAPGEGAEAIGLGEF